MNKDTIANQLHYSLAFARMSRGQSDYGDSIRAAEYEGIALGHAFRAAELAYDLGRQHGNDRAFEYATRKLESRRLERESSWWYK